MALLAMIHGLEAGAPPSGMAILAMIHGVEARATKHVPETLQMREVRRDSPKKQMIPAKKLSLLVLIRYKRGT